MSDRFHPIEDSQFVAWVFEELKTNNSIFGIPLELACRLNRENRLSRELFGSALGTPIGVAAGPHTQMAQNIIVAWLCGARFIELKTVQTLDEITVSKPCIDMQDLGFNVEWSQELKVEQSFEEYVRAWVMIHALHRRLGFVGDTPGVIFNVSVGYNMEGLLKPNMQWYFARIAHAEEAIERYVSLISRYFPEVREVSIPTCLSNNVTLSTMHGCPPHEIEQIATYLLEEKRLHTAVKLNPTLLGPDRVRAILNQHLGFDEIVVPDSAFGHDLKYEDAIPMLVRLREKASRAGLYFGVKLSNTLEVENHRDVFASTEKVMYMSGRALHAVTVSLAARLAEEFRGELPMSFSAGADAFNLPDLIASGFHTVTVCSDVLKPGSYLRLRQYITVLEDELNRIGAKDLDDFIRKRAAAAHAPTTEPLRQAAWHNLRVYASRVIDDPRLRKGFVKADRTKTTRQLGLFDCIMAPCTDECPVDQQVPYYMIAVRGGRWDEAVRLVRQDNVMAAILGRACLHPCEQVCIRTHYDQPLAIREIKRFIMDRERGFEPSQSAPPKTARVAVIGAGPCGLSAAYFLAQAGYPVTVFEEREYAGGMVAGTIPAFRAKAEALEQDLRLLGSLGVEFRFRKRAGVDFTLARLRNEGFKYIVVGIGAQKGRKLGVDGEEAEGVYEALDFLRRVKEGKLPSLGKRVLVVGGGDVAMDCARTAWRLTRGNVTIVYRRTIREMPASEEERRQALAEGIEILELVRPVRVQVRNGKVAGLVGLRMKLGEPDESGRRRPVDIPGTEFEMSADNIIVAISQEPEVDWISAEGFDRDKSGYLRVDPQTLETSIPNVFAGGDIIEHGPESIVRALGDGKRIAAAIRSKEEGWALPDAIGAVEALTREQWVDLRDRRSRRIFRVTAPERPVAERGNFEEVELTFDEDSARREAARCLECHRICSLCESVCPNRAFFTYRVSPTRLTLPKLRRFHGDVGYAGSERFQIRQALQVAVLTDFCNECGNCATFCPTAGRPYRDKPRFYLHWSDFAKERDNAFMLLRAADVCGIRGRFSGETHTLIYGKETVYVCPQVKARLSNDTLDLLEVVPTAAFHEGEEVSLYPCAVLFALLTALRNSMPFLPAAEI